MEDISKQIKCCISTGAGHYVNEAVLLTCGGNACRKCIENLDDYKSKCKYCLKEHKKDEMLKAPSNHQSIKLLIEEHLKDLKKQLLEEYKETIESFKEENINNEIDKRFEDIEYQIEARIESIINEIHKYRDEFMAELKQMREYHKKSVFSNESMKPQSQLTKICDILKIEFDLNYDNFMKTQEIVKESQDLLQHCLNEINEIKFISTVEPFEKSIIGELGIPVWKNIKEVNEIPIDDRIKLNRIVHLKSKNKLISTDFANKCLFLLDLENNSMQKFEHEKINKPGAICCGIDDKLLITEHSNGRKVMIFDRDLNFEREFEIKNVVVLCQMKVDLFSKDRNLLFITHFDANKVTIWNYENGYGGEYVNSFNIEYPNFIEFNKEFVYINSYVQFKIKKGIVQNIESGSNCIFVLNKTNYELVNKIECENWLSPWGICLDKHFNVMTTAYEINESKVILNNNRFLYIFNDKGNLKRKIKLQQNCLAREAHDIILFDNRLVRLHSKSIKIIELIE